MKIVVISPNAHHLEEIGRVLRGSGHQPVPLEGGKSKLREAAERERPDLILVEGMCRDPNELAQVEAVTSQFPHTAVMLLCSSTSPEFLINSMRAGVREVLPSPVPPAALQAAVERVAHKQRAGQPAAPGRVLAFIGAKGGSGATFLATSLASQLAETRSVLLIDLNLQFGDALSFVHDGSAPTTLADVAREIARLDASFLAASCVKIAPNFSILAAPEDPAQAMEVTPEHVDAIVALAATQYDFVLLDLGRQIDNQTVRALDRAHTVFIVMQTSLPAVRNAKKLLAVFRSLGYGPDKAALIVNRYEKGGAIGVSDIERALGPHAIHTVPNSYRQVTAAINQGEPLAASARGNPVSRNLAEFARGLAPQPDDEPGLLRRLLGRA